MKKAYLVMSIIMSLCFGPIVISNKSILVFWGDGHEQVYYFIINSIQNFRMMFSNMWDMSLGLGGSTFAHVFNGLFSPFNLLASLFGYLPEHVIPLMLYIMRFAVTTFFAYKWIAEITTNERSRITGAIMTVFSAWVMTNFHLSFFQDAYVFMVSTLYFSECLLKNRRGLMFAISISILIIINPYFAYMFSFYLLIYLTFRFYSLYPESKFSEFSAKVFMFLKYYGLGLLCSMFILLPFAQIILNNPRVGTTFRIADFLPTLNQYNLYLMFTSLFSPVLNDFDASQYISRLNPSFSNLLLFQSFVFSFHIFLLMVLNSLWLPYKHKIKLYCFMALVYLITLFPIFYRILNGNGDFRWSFFISFSNILFTVSILENYDLVSRKYKMFNVFILIVTYLGIGYLSLNKNLMNPAFIDTIKLNTVLSILIVAIYGIETLNVKWTRSLWLILLIFESVFVLYNRMYYNGDGRFVNVQDFKTLYAEDIDVFDEIKNIDDSFYRVDTMSLPANLPLIYNYNGFTFYSSLYNSELRAFMDNRLTENWKQGYLPSKFVMKNLLGSKYFVTLNENSQPFGFIDYKRFGEWYIYKNKYFIDLGYATTQTISYEDANQFSQAIKDYIFYQAIVQTKEGNTSEFNLPELIKGKLVNDKFTGEYSNGYLFFDYSASIPHSSCKLDFYLNNEVIRSENINEYAYYMHRIDSGFDKVYVYCSNNYNNEEFTPIDVYYVGDELLDKMYTNLMNSDHFYQTTYSENKIESKIKISYDRSYVFTSIPYDEDWIVRVNGNIVETLKVNQSFIGFVLDQGEYNIEMIYQPKAFWMGLSISLVSIVTLIIYQIKKRLSRLFAQ